MTVFNYGEFILTGDSVPAARPLKQTFLCVYASSEGVGIVVPRIVHGSEQCVRCDVVTALSRDCRSAVAPADYVISDTEMASSASQVDSNFRNLVSKYFYKYFKW